MTGFPMKPGEKHVFFLFNREKTSFYDLNRNHRLYHVAFMFFVSVFNPWNSKLRSLVYIYVECLAYLVCCYGVAGMPTVSLFQQIAICTNTIVTC